MLVDCYDTANAVSFASTDNARVNLSRPECVMSRSRPLVPRLEGLKRRQLPESVAKADRKARGAAQDGGECASWSDA